MARIIETGTATHAENAGFQLLNAAQPAFPVLISIPHAGRDYPPELINNLRVSPMELMRLEDRYADRLIGPALSAGMTVIVAHRARAWIDLNRAEDDLDPEMVSPRIGGFKSSNSMKMRGGLGLIPRRLMHVGDLWKRPLSADDIEHRLDRFHRPYHQAVEQTLCDIRDRFGTALLVDVHSMPPLAATTTPAPQIVIGDRFGQCAPALYAEMLLARLKSLNIPAALNHPYPGDYILRRHGNAQGSIHAIQIEVDRSLYLDSMQREPGPGLESTTSLISELLFFLVDLLGGHAIPLAAE
jgi:N-formylglutamate amidohydrolase